MTLMPLLQDQEHLALVKLANGNGRAQIAQSLKVSENTVKNLLTSVCTALGAENAYHAIAIGFCTGLLIESNIEGFNVQDAS